MKKLFLSIAILIVFKASNGQGLAGVIAGVGLPKHSYQKLGFNESLSWYLGLSGSFAMSSRFFLEPELFYSRKKFEFHGSADESIHAKFDYLNLPFLIKWHPVRKLDILLGPQIAYLLHADVRGGVPLSPINFQYNSFDWGLNGKLKYTVGRKMGLSLSYYCSVSKSNEFDRGTYQTLQAGLFYNISCRVKKRT